jgi:hypothetical protein
VLGVLPELQEPSLSFARLNWAIFTWKKNAPPTQMIAAKTCTKAIASYRVVLYASSSIAEHPSRVDPAHDTRGERSWESAQGLGSRAS